MFALAALKQKQKKPTGTPQLKTCIFATLQNGLTETALYRKPFNRLEYMYFELVPYSVHSMP